MVDGGSLGTDRAWWMGESRYRQTMVSVVSLGTVRGGWWEFRYRQTMVSGGSLGTDRPW